MSTPQIQVCLFCGGDASESSHDVRCDGRQGQIEARFIGATFDGVTYDPLYDQARLTRQIGRVWDLMHDGLWRTLEEMATETGDPPASISARLRDLRKRRFGSYTVSRRARGDRADGLFEYRLGEHEPVHQ